VEDVVEIAQDRLRFVKLEVAVLERWNPAEGMALEIRFALQLLRANDCSR
jgi:hypothetical protein